MNTTQLLRRHVRGSIPLLCLLQSLVLVRSLLGGTGFILIIPALDSLAFPVNTGDPKLQFLSTLMPGAASLTGILLIFLLLMISMAVISYCTNVLEEKVQQSVIAGLRKEIFQLTLGAEWQFTGGVHRADYSRIQTDEVESVSTLLQYLTEISTALITLIIYTLLCLYLSPAITLIAASLSVLIVIAVYPIQRRIVDAGVHHLAASESLYRQTGEQINGIRAIKSSQSEDKHVQKFDTAVDSLHKEELRYTRLSSITQLLHSSIAAVAFCTLAWIAIDWLHTDTAILVIVALVFSRLLPLVARLQTLVQRIGFMIPALREVTEYVRTLLQHQEQEQSEEAGTGPAPDMNRGLTLSEVSYRYPGSHSDALHRMNANIPARSLILVSGSSGIGKSTLADMIAGLILPDSGVVTAGETKLSKTNTRAWSRNVTYVPQTPFLIDASIRENLCLLTDTPIAQHQLHDVLEQASASFVFRLPEGMETRIGEDGSRLSAGERQRLLLARALLEHKPILILDESTSNLDTQTEMEFLKILDKLKVTRTIIMISHKRYLAEIVDQVIVIDEPDRLAPHATTEPP